MVNKFKMDYDYHFKIKQYKKYITLIYNACNCNNDKDDAFEGYYCGYWYSDIFESDEVLIKM